MYKLITELVMVKVRMVNKRVNTTSSLKYSPHIFNGASSSKSMGCDKKISLDLRHRPLISPSDSWTFLPGLAPRTVEQLHNNCYKCDRHRSQGLTEIGTQWRTRTAEPRSRHGLPAAYLPRVSILCCRCSICHCLSLYRRARRVGRDYCRAGVRGSGDSRSRRRNTMLDYVLIGRDVKPACKVFGCIVDGDSASCSDGTRMCLTGSRIKSIK